MSLSRNLHVPFSTEDLAFRRRITPQTPVAAPPPESSASACRWDEQRTGVIAFGHGMPQVWKHLCASEKLCFHGNFEWLNLRYSKFCIHQYPSVSQKMISLSPRSPTISLSLPMLSPQEPGGPCGPAPCPAVRIARVTRVTSRRAAAGAASSTARGRAQCCTAGVVEADL